MRVGHVAATEPGEVVVPLHLDAVLGEPVRQAVEVLHDDAGVGLAGRPEVLLDAEVQLDAAGRNQAPPRAASTGGLGTSVMPSTVP